MTEDQMKGLFGGGEAGAGGGTPHEMDREQRRAARQEARQERRAARQRNPEEVAQAHDFINRYTTGNPSEGFSNDEALGYLRETRGELSPEEWRQAATATINNLPEDQRKQFNEMLQRRQAGAGMVTIDRTGQAQATAGRSQGQPGGSGLDDMLGGLFGGLLGGGMAMPQSGGNVPSSSASGHGPLDDFFGGLFGHDEPTQQPRQAQQPQQGGGGVDEVLQNPLGKAVLGGLAAFALKQLMDKQQG